MKEKQLRLKRVRWIVCFLTCVVMLLILPSIEARAESKPNYLTFTAEKDSSIIRFSYVNGTNVQYSTDGGVTWSDYEKRKALCLKAGDRVCFKGEEVKTDFTHHFGITGMVAASGSVTSLTDENGGDPNVRLSNYCYAYMFDGCRSLTSAPELPATTLSDNCYYQMFSDCINLTSAPALPATKLTKGCYSSMFVGCTSLTSAPALPATTLSEWCYDDMFRGCTSLTSAPALPAAILRAYCYEYMFEGCTSLINAPALPATNLALCCYSGMFEGCTSLINAPALPATTLEVECYTEMFSGCTNLISAPELPATTLAQFCYSSMFKGCSKLDISTNKEGRQEWSLPTPTSGSTAQKWNTNMFLDCPNVDFDGLGSKEPQTGVTYYQKIPETSEEEQKPDNKPSDTQDNKPGSTPDSNSGLTPENNYDNEKDYRFTIPVSQAGTKVASNQGMNFYEDSNGNKRCYKDNGVPVINEFKCDGTYTYYFQLDGTCMKSRLSYHPDGEHVIYLDENGHEVFSNFANVKQTIEGNAVDDFCFFDVHGYLYVDVVTFDQTGTKLYYANQYGVMERSKWFEFSDTCKWADGNPFDKAGGKYGYAMEDGSLMTNTATYDWEGRLCYLQGNGVAKY